MRNDWVGLWAVLFCLAGWGTVVGQNQSAEFIESSSPLPHGGRVISRSSPNARIQTVTTGEAAVPGANLSNTGGTQLPASSRPETPVVTGGMFQSYPSSNRYAYGYPYAYPYRYPDVPVSNGSATSQRSVVLHPPIRATASPTNSVPYQIPTLGITNTITNREQKSFTACPCNAQSVYRATVTNPAVATGPTPAAVAPQTVPPVCVPKRSNPFFGPASDPQLAIQPNGCYYPPVNATGAYQPVFRMANMPPGVYVGEGMFGRPQTYRDGQPVRNLFRFVFP